MHTGGINTQQLFPIIARVLVLMTCIPIHECAHGFIAYKLGDNTARDSGRLTLNPLRHFDLMGTVALVLIGFGWAKPVPVNPNRFRGNRKVGMALTAAAGPAANFLMALVILIFYKLFFILIFHTSLKQAPAAEMILQLLLMMVTTNITLGVFNLIPVNPLDGSRILGLILPDKLYFKLLQYERYLYLGVLLLLVSGILSTPISVVSHYMLRGLDFLTSFIDLLL